MADQKPNYSLGELVLFGEAVFWLGFARFLLAVLPASRISAWLGRPAGRNDRDSRTVDGKAVRRISWILAAAAVRLPWNTRCLVRAMAGRMMLKRRGLPSRIHLGLAHGGPAGLQAHAWLRCGHLVVCGAGEMDQYQSITEFND